MTLTSPHRLAIAAVVTALALAPAARAQPPAAPTTASLQNRSQALADAPQMHEFYALTIAAFAQGPGKVDVDAYEAKSFAIFRAFGAANGMDPATIQRRAKLVPRQMVQIVRDDPTVLANYENFMAAIMGPP
jgi:hypothetical protein